MFGPRKVVGVSKLTGICRFRFRGIIVGLLIILFEVEYRLAGNSVRCPICECFVVIGSFLVGYWCSARAMA